jgi:hypothetical protein
VVLNLFCPADLAVLWVLPFEVSSLWALQGTMPWWSMAVAPARPFQGHSVKTQEGGWQNHSRIPQRDKELTGIQSGGSGTVPWVYLFFTDRCLFQDCRKKLLWGQHELVFHSSSKCCQELHVPGACASLGISEQFGQCL